MNLELLQKMISRALECAHSEFKRPVSVAVCDSHGLLLAFMRMPGATLRSVTHAQKKAYSAAFMGTNTDAFAERLKRENVPINFFGGDELTAMGGGVVLKNAAGEVIGGVGVSGLPPQDDQAVALKAAELFNQA